MRVWALIPEALTRPVIINLWAMTGVGKTDLVRHLISELATKHGLAVEIQPEGYLHVPTYIAHPSD